MISTRVLSEHKYLKVFPQVSEDRRTRTGFQLHLAPTWRKIRDHAMACDRVERILQAVFHTQNAPGSAEDLASDCRRIPSYCQDPHGEAEGIYLLPACC